MSVRIIKFWTKYETRNGTMHPVDMVEYCAPGQAHRSTTTAPVSHLSRVRPVIDSDDIAGKFAQLRWQAIQPAYEAWKAGHEVPANGIPIAAWPGITPEQAEVFRTMGLRTVEEIAEASDSVMGRVQMPGARDIQANAKRFLEAQDSQRTAASLAEKDRQISTLNEQLEELRQIVLSQANASRGEDLDPDGSEVPRRRGPGRPRKEREEVAAP